MICEFGVCQGTLNSIITLSFPLKIVTLTRQLNKIQRYTFKKRIFIRLFTSLYKTKTEIAGRPTLEKCVLLPGDFLIM